MSRWPTSPSDRQPSDIWRAGHAIREGARCFGLRHQTSRVLTTLAVALRPCLGQKVGAWPVNRGSSTGQAPGLHSACVAGPLGGGPDPSTYERVFGYRVHTAQLADTPRP
jgi:hypothetical protein